MRIINWIATILTTLAMALTATAQTSATTAPPPDPIIGTWVVKVPGPTPEQDFYALQTFHQNGTFTENSSLLPTLTEGPAQGVWRRDGDNYKLSFILFAFGEHAELAGYIRVRCGIKLAADRIDADTVVDFINLDGTVEAGIGEGPYFGLRQKVDTPANLADVPQHAESLSGERRAGGEVGNRLPDATAGSRRWSRMAFPKSRK